MARVLKGFHSFTCKPTRSIRNRHEPYLPLPSQRNWFLNFGTPSSCQYAAAGCSFFRISSADVVVCAVLDAVATSNRASAAAAAATTMVLSCGRQTAGGVANHSAQRPTEPVRPPLQLTAMQFVRCRSCRTWRSRARFCTHRLQRATRTCGFSRLRQSNSRDSVSVRHLKQVRVRVRSNSSNCKVVWWSYWRTKRVYSLPMDRI